MEPKWIIELESEANNAYITTLSRTKKLKASLVVVGYLHNLEITSKDQNLRVMSIVDTFFKLLPIWGISMGRLICPM